MTSRHAQQPLGVNVFWQAYLALEDTGQTINHANVGHLIAINLPILRSQADEAGVELPETCNGLKNLLRQSKSPRYLGEWNVNSAYAATKIKCMIFEGRP
jgi:hypothetical protein